MDEGARGQKRWKKGERASSSSSFRLSMADWIEGGLFPSLFFSRRLTEIVRLLPYEWMKKRHF